MTFSFEWEGKAAGVNKRLMRSKHGKFMLTPEYRAFKESLGWAINAAETPPDPLQGILTADLHQVTNHDIDALQKPVLDALESCGVIGNDKQVRTITVNTAPKAKRKDLDRIRFMVWDGSERIVCGCE
jgi:Holliday junction resolvase RusA-like endonuclease